MSPKKVKRKIPLFDLKVSAAAKKEVTDVLKKGWLSTGPKVAAFEKKLAEMLEIPNVCAVSSGTTGLFLALKALDVKEGDEVITTPFTFVATIEVILQIGATPVLADIDPNTLNISSIEIEKKLSDKTKAVLAVDMAGHPAEYDSIRKICQSRAIKLISDSAHSFGAEYNDKSIPNYTDISVYSFYPTKNITTAEGGAVVSRDEKLIAKVRLLAKHGLTSNAYDRQQSGMWKYDAPVLGYKANMSDVHAAIGLGELTTFKANQKKKSALIKKYQTKLKDVSEWLQVPSEQDNSTHAWHLFIVQLAIEKLKINRNQFIEKMAENGIECGVHYQPIFDLTFYSNFFSLNLNKYPHAHRAGERVVSLPLYPTLKPADIDHICDCAIEILNTNSC